MSKDIFGYKIEWPSKKPALKLFLCCVLAIALIVMLAYLHQRDDAAKPIPQDSIIEGDILCDRTVPYTATYDCLYVDEDHILVGSKVGFLRIFDHEGNRISQLQTRFDELCLHGGRVVIRLDDTVGIYAKDGSFIESEPYVYGKFPFKQAHQFTLHDITYVVKMRDSHHSCLLIDGAEPTLLAVQSHYKWIGVKIALIAILALCGGYFLMYWLINDIPHQQLELLGIGKHKVKYLSYRQPYSPLKIEHEALDLSKLDQSDSAEDDDKC